jgi:DNA-binding CsgD family transcriptional regulator
MENILAPTAGPLRQQYRENQANIARLQLLHDSSRAMAADDASALAVVLTHAMEFATFEAGAVLLEDAGALRVCAARGAVFPLGTRFPVSGILTTMLQPDASITIRKKSVSRLLLSANSIAEMEIFFPLIHQGKTKGILVLLSCHRLAEPVAADLLTLGTLASMLALSLKDAVGVNNRDMNERIKKLSALLTTREREVLALLPHGLTNADIGHKLGIAAGTAKVHVERIIHKLGLQDRTQAAALLVELGLGSSGVSLP